MFKQSLIVLTILALAFFACQSPLEIETPEPDPKIVINCLFSPDTAFTVRISRTASLNDSTNLYLSNAECEIWSAGKKLADLPHIGNGFYQNSELIPKTGKAYSIKVLHPKLGQASGSSRVPCRKPHIFSADKEDFAVMYDNDPNLEGIAHSKFEISFRNTPDSLTYSEFFLFADWYWPDDEERERYWKCLILYSLDEAVKAEDLMGYEPHVLTFTNQFSDDTIQHSSFLYKPSWISGSNGDYSYGKHQILWHFRHLSKEMYNYRRNIIKHTYNNYNEILWTMGDPVQMYSNIENGYGIFAGYTEHTEILTDTIPDW